MSVPRLNDDLRIRYRGPGTGLRLERPDNIWIGIDVGINRYKGPMTLCVLTGADPEGGGGKGSTIELGQVAVTLLAEACLQCLANFQGVAAV
jgi:hypothetical protein